MKKLVTVAACFLLLLTACGGEPTALSHIRLPVGYIPSIQFAPLYVAVEKGYFTEAGIEVEFDYSYETDAVALVGAENLQFAVASGEQVVLARSQGLPVVYVAAWYQKYPVSVASAVELNIQSPVDLRGQTIGLPGLFGANYIGLRALLHAGGLSEADVTLDSIMFTQFDAFIGGRENVICGYTTNEPVRLRAQGYDINELRVSDYVQLASNGLITNEKTIAENPDLVQQMVTAFLRGLSDAIADPESAYRISTKFVEGLEPDDPVQKQVLTTSIELWKTDRLGATDAAAWENMQTVLLDMDLMTTPLDLSQAYTNEFLP